MTEDTQVTSKNEENIENTNSSKNVDLNENNSNNIELKENNSNKTELKESISNNIEIKENSPNIIEKSLNNSNMVESNENNSNNAKSNENNSNNIESNESGVIEEPNMSVKDIRKMFRGGPDYQDFAKPKNIRPNRIPSLSTVVRYDSTRTMSSESKDQNIQDDHENLKSPTAQQIVAIFEADIQKEKENLIRSLSRRNSRESGGSDGSRRNSMEVFGKKFVDLTPSDVKIPETHKIPVENEQAVVKSSISSSPALSSKTSSIILEDDIPPPVKRNDIGKLREELKSQSSSKNATLDDALNDFDNVFAEFE